jgi:hypothetical protein
MAKYRRSRFGTSKLVTLGPALKTGCLGSRQVSGAPLYALNITSSLHARVMGKNKAACISVYQTQYVNIFFNPSMQKKSNTAKKLLLTASADAQ